MTKTAIAVCLGAVVLSGCSMAWGVHQSLPYAPQVSGALSTSGHVDVYRDGDRPRRPIILIAKLGANGNGYATDDTLVKTLVKEAQKVDADCLVITNSSVSRDETVGSYGGGLLFTSQIKRPHLYGIACKYSKVIAGLNADKNGLVGYVPSGTPAARAGIVEGDKLLALNGEAITSSPYVAEREVSLKSPGDKVTVDYLDKNGEKHTTVLTLDAAPQ